MTNREMAEKLVEIANELENLLAAATPEQYGSIAGIERTGLNVLNAIDDLGFVFFENRNGDFELY